MAAAVRLHSVRSCTSGDTTNSLQIRNCQQDFASKFWRYHGGMPFRNARHLVDVNGSNRTAWSISWQSQNPCGPLWWRNLWSGSFGRKVCVRKEPFDHCAHLTEHNTGYACSSCLRQASRPCSPLKRSTRGEKSLLQSFRQILVACTCEWR